MVINITFTERHTRGQIAALSLTFRPWTYHLTPLSFSFLIYYMVIIIPTHGTAVSEEIKSDFVYKTLDTFWHITRAQEIIAVTIIPGTWCWEYKGEWGRGMLGRRHQTRASAQAASWAVGGSMGTSGERASHTMKRAEQRKGCYQGVGHGLGSSLFLSARMLSPTNERQPHVS